jgi:hypothetical protein
MAREKFWRVYARVFRVTGVGRIAAFYHAWIDPAAADDEPQRGGFAEQIIESALPQLGALPGLGESAERG